MKLRRTIAIGLICSLAACSICIAEASESVDINQFEETVVISDYDVYLQKNSDILNAVQNYQIDIKSFDSAFSDIQTSDQKDNSVLIKENGAVEYTVNIPSDGMYNLRLNYLPLNESETEIKFALHINGQLPFNSSDKLAIPVFWKDEYEEKKYDGNGNQITSPQIQAAEGADWLISDDTGVVAEPYLFKFSKGENKLRLESFSCDLQILGIELLAPENILPYKEAVNKNDLQNIAGNSIVIEGEEASVKTDRDIIPETDSGSVKVSPNSYSKMLLNYIGGETWSTPGETLYWDFETEKSGWYSFAFSYRQSEVINGVSRRWLKIDGETPFDEARNIAFKYSTGWELYEWNEKDNVPYYVYIEEGEHTLSLSSTLADASDEYSKLSGVVESLGDEYVEIIMITGEAPDENRSYELFKTIPDFQETLKSNYTALEELVAEMQNQSAKRGSQYIAAMQDMIRVLRQMYDSPYLAHQYVADYYSSYTTLSSWLYEMKSMPLSLDRIYITPYGAPPEIKSTSFLDSVGFGIMRFLNSFATDYSSVSNIKDKGNEKKLTLWINWGMDQAMSLNNLIRDSFTASTGTPVEVKVVSASLINGLMSGNFPDLVLNQSRTVPIDLGIRGALYDLKQFEDFEQVTDRFMNDATLPYEYNGKCYALPETQTFYIMFYRTDILESLGIEVPDNWDEFIKASTVLQRNNMQVYFPYAAYTNGSAIGGLSLYPTFMVQKDISLFDDALTEAAIAEEGAVEVFDYWTKLYTDYKYMKEADFYNRFRTGSIPLGIALYSPYYMQLATTAPEIQGRWSIASVPGFTGDNRVSAGSGTACAIINKSDNINEAWEFLKWWTKADTQVRYNNNIESVLGSIGRVPTSNVEALKSLSWDSEHLKTIIAQWENVTEIPQVPGSYYLARAIDQSYWEVVNGQSNVKDALKKWDKIADLEIERKINEYIKQ